MNNKIAIIGAGLGGLSAAIRLANAGLYIDLYEQNNSVGGKAGEINEQGFRFDTGPSLLTMPFVIQDLFNDCGEKIEDYLNIKRLEIICKYFYSDNTIIKAYSDTEKFANEIESKTSDSSTSLINYQIIVKPYMLWPEIFFYKKIQEAFQLI